MPKHECILSQNLIIRKKNSGMDMQNAYSFLRSISTNWYVVNVRESLNNNNNKETDAHKYNSYVKESLVRANQDMDIRYVLIFCCDI